MINLNSVKTQFGMIYVETLVDPREEEDRIKIYDSDTKYIDYFSGEFLTECAEEMEHSIEEEYAARLQSWRYEKNICQLLDMICSNWVTITMDKNTLDEDDDYVNRIGKYYFVTKD